MEYKKEYFGFVYRWWDMKRDMYYIGSHHGSTDDGYVCSSERMLNAHKKRPSDFVRMVVAHNAVDDPKVTLLLEQAHMSAEGDIAANKQYYNLKNEAEGGWSHITEEIKEKRIQSLKDRQARDGLTEKEIASYPHKIQARLDRIAEKGFTKLEQKQHHSYGCKCKVITPEGDEFTYATLGEASRELGIDCVYGKTVTLQGRTYKGYKVYITEEPNIDCRTFKV